MKKLLTISLVLLFARSPAMALEMDLYAEEGPQDPIGVEAFLGHWTEHEFGTFTFFPQDDLITSSVAHEYSTLSSCSDGSDDPGVWNVLVEIENLTNRTVPLWYVADPETTITNFDGYIGDTGVLQAELAFRIDNVGINRPLFFESLGQNNLFEPGERWYFILQDFDSPSIYNVGPLGAAADFGSPGVGLVSSYSSEGFQWSSTGSLVTPEPATLGLLLLGGLALLRRRR